MRMGVHGMMVVVAGAALAGSALAQTATVPPQFAQRTGDMPTSTMLRSGNAIERTHQVIWSEGLLVRAGLRDGAAITGLTYRGVSMSSGTIWPANQVVFPSYVIRIGRAAHGPAAMSPTLASNYAQPPTLVRSGPLSVPAESFVTGSAAPPAGSSPFPWGYEIAFDQPYIYSGGDLVIETWLVGTVDTDVTLFLDSLFEQLAAPGERGYRSITSPAYGSMTGWYTSGATPITRLSIRGNPECYANCDGSELHPIVNVDDVGCFINQFVTAQSLPHEAQVSHYANCDGSSTAPVLTVSDLLCFVDAFAQGCP